MSRFWKIHGHKFDLCKLGKFYRESILEMTQSEVAELTGLKQPNISKHEAGQYMASVHNAYVDLGITYFADYMSQRQADVLIQIVSGSWHKRLHEISKFRVPSRV